MLPLFSGVESVGENVNDTSGILNIGHWIAAIMSGMARNRNSSHAEFVTVPASNVIPLDSNLLWVELAALLESYATAWRCWQEDMHIKKSYTILIRVGTQRRDSVGA